VKREEPRSHLKVSEVVLGKKNFFLMRAESWRRDRLWQYSSWTCV